MSGMWNVIHKLLFFRTLFLLLRWVLQYVKKKLPTEYINVLTFSRPQTQWKEINDALMKQLSLQEKNIQKRMKWTKKGGISSNCAATCQDMHCFLVGDKWFCLEWCKESKNCIGQKMSPCRTSLEVDSCHLILFSLRLRSKLLPLCMVLKQQ